MRLFGRKRSNDEVEERCPHCGEPVPDQAVDCMMCGVDLRPLRGRQSSEELESSTSPPPSG
jgi:zinc-ribbon domain